MLNKFDTATPTQIIEAMAEAMRRRGDGCTADDLKLVGFSQKQIDQYHAEANEHALALSDRVTRARIPTRRAA